MYYPRPGGEKKVRRGNEGPPRRRRHSLPFFIVLAAILASPGSGRRLPGQTGGAVCKECSRSAEIVACDSTTPEVAISTFRTFIAQALMTPCFRLKSWLTADRIPEADRPFLSTEAKPPEYLISALYEEDLTDKVSGRLKIDLSYNGPFPEPVASWTTESESKVTPWQACKNRMFTNPSTGLKKVRPIETTVLKDFEKRPRACDLQLEDQIVLPGEEVQAEITGFRDDSGRTSREFNRIVVQALEGEIIPVGGAALESDPALKAFPVGEGTIRFTYKAPDPCTSGEDTIVVYNSCDILREDLYPLSKTGLDAKIAEQKVKIACADATFKITATARWEEDDSRGRTEGATTAVFEGTMTLDRRTSVSRTEVYDLDQATCRLELRQKEFTKKPRPGCPDLVGELGASGQVLHTPSRSTNYLRITPDDKAGPSGSIKMSLSFEPLTIKNRRRSSPSAPKCNTYEERTLQLPPALSIDGPTQVDQNGRLTGRLTQRFVPGGPPVVMFMFNPALAMLPGTDMTVEWEIVRKKK